VPELVLPKLRLLSRSPDTITTATPNHMIAITTAMMKARKISPSYASSTGTSIGGTWTVAPGNFATSGPASAPSALSDAISARMA